MDLNRKYFPLVGALVFALAFSSCSISPNLTSNLENDELYLDRNEEFISDASNRIVKWIVRKLKRKLRIAKHGVFHDF